MTDRSALPDAMSTSVVKTAVVVAFDPPSDVWALGHLTVRASPIAGSGLFANEQIAADEIVFRLGGRLASAEELNSLILDANTTGRYVDTITVFEDAHLVLPERTIVHFANHSCDPNLWHDGPYEIRARRAIPEGEELAIDYGTNSGAPGFAMTCTCGAAQCRRVVTSDDWRRPDLQRRYGPHWVPALLDRIHDLGDGPRAM